VSSWSICKERKKKEEEKKKKRRRKEEEMVNLAEIRLNFEKFEIWSKWW
jgi:hypothetical protein